MVVLAGDDRGMIRNHQRICLRQITQRNGAIGDLT